MPKPNLLFNAFRQIRLEAIHPADASLLCGLYRKLIIMLQPCYYDGMQKTKKLLFWALIGVAVLSVAGMARLLLAQNSYNDPEYQAYKQQYIQCAMGYDATVTPDTVIYDSWKRGEEIYCK